MSKTRGVAWLLAVLAPFILIACGGGSSSSSNDSSTATALVVAEKVSVVDATLSGSVAAAVAPLRIGIARVTGAELAASTDYKLDKTQVWVSERSADSFNQINNILCMMAQSRADAMLNQGAYIALVDKTQCDTNKSSASSAAEDSQNQSSSSDMPDYMTFIVNATRANGSSPEYISVWIHEKGNVQHQDPEKLILVKITITEGKSDANPYGLFSMTYKGYPTTNGVPDTSQVMFKGVLKAERVGTEVLLKYAEQNFGAWPEVRKITLNKQASGTGKGSVYDQHNNMNNGTQEVVTSQFDIAFDASNFLRNDGASTVCLDRNQFEESAWRYGLYDMAGTRVNRNSGFSINTKADGSGSYGFIGYWGLWLDNSATVVGNTLYKFDYSTNTATPYTLFTAGGKLKKHTKKSMTLGEIKGIPLGYSEFSGSTGTNYQVVWDGTNFNKTASMPQNCGNNCNWQPMSPVPINLGNLMWSELNFWSQSLSGQVRIKLDPCTYAPGSPGSYSCAATDITPVIFFAEDLVYPTDTIPGSLACYDNCPQVGANGEAYISMMSSGPSNTATLYTFDPVTMLLKDSNSNPVVMSVATTTNPWGVMSGAMFYPSPENVALLACDWDPLQTCGYKAWSALDVFYTWETGPGSWNQFSALLDPATGAPLAFEPPLSVKYVHHQAGSPFDGATFMMDYSGFGNLQGIPGKCVNMDTGLEANCTNSSSIRYVPAFLIPPTQTSGQLTTVSVDATTYLVKPLELEQRMMKVPTGNCSALTVTSYTLPDLNTEWSEPGIGVEPVVTSAPAVIGGVVQ